MSEPPMSEPFVGDRIVVRYRLGVGAPADWRPTANPASHGPSQSDVTGILLDDGDPLVVERDGTTESIPRAAITSVRLLSRVTVRNSEIRDLEAAAADAWPGVESAHIDGWLLRAGGGLSRRANSAVPVEFGAGVDTTTRSAIRGWFAERGLAPLVAAPDRLLPAGQMLGRPASGEIQMLTGSVDGIGTRPGPSVRLHATPGPDWVRAYFGADVDVAAATAVVSASAGDVVFASVGDGAGMPVAIGRASMTGSPAGTAWLGLTALWTADRCRGQGLSSAVVAALLDWGIERGATHCYLQVEAANRAAGSWYRRMGFGLHHAYRYVDIAGEDLPA